MGYAKEFNHLFYNVPEVFTTNTAWEDVSWHNDICPRWENKELELAVWVDNMEPELREYDDWKQYTVFAGHVRGDGTFALHDDCIFATEDAKKLEAWLDMFQIKQHLEEAFKLAGPYGERFADELASLIAECTESMTELSNDDAQEDLCPGGPC